MMRLMETNSEEVKPLPEVVASNERYLHKSHQDLNLFFDYLEQARAWRKVINKIRLVTLAEMPATFSMKGILLPEFEKIEKELYGLATHYSPVGRLP